MVEKIIIGLVILCILAWFIPNYCTSKRKLQVGDAAPDFALIDETGNVHTLGEQYGRKVALFFYPKDNTPGCTKEVCNIRDNYAQLKDAGITIFGISGGTPKDKQLFRKQQNLPYPLLTANENILQLYGVQGSLFTLYMPKRETFLINEHGIIVAIITNVNLNDHAQQIVDTFAQAPASHKSANRAANTPGQHSAD